MLVGIDWENSALYDRLMHVDRGGIRWEWLRRQARYQRWYEDHSEEPLVSSRSIKQWGLHFRGKPSAPCR